VGEFAAAGVRGSWLVCWLLGHGRLPSDSTLKTVAQSLKVPKTQGRGCFDSIEGNDRIPLQQNTMNDSNGDPNVWMEQIHPTKVAIWQEYISHLRHLSDEVLKGMKLFLAINGFVLILITVSA